jgi:hypothetical protein
MTVTINAELAETAEIANAFVFPSRPKPRAWSPEPSHDCIR